MAEVSTQEVALQTDAALTDRDSLAAMKLKASAAEQRRILIMQRCDPRQIDFACWTPIPKPESEWSPEMHYLSHVRSRFPGTIGGGCRLAGRGSDRRLTTPHMAALRKRLPAEATASTESSISI